MQHEGRDRDRSTPPRSAAAEHRAAPATSSAGAVALLGALPYGPVRRKAAASAADVARAGFQGAGEAVPHQADLERSFGRDLGHVQAHTDAGARAACRTLGAEAYAMGDHVAFASETPSPATVAHELTHVTQSEQRGPAAKGGGAGVDTAGEAQAAAVERAVADGQPASVVLGRGGQGRGEGPALSALSDLGLSFGLPNAWTGDGNVEAGVTSKLVDFSSPAVGLYPAMGGPAAAAIVKARLIGSISARVEAAVPAEDAATAALTGPAAPAVLAANAERFGVAVTAAGGVRVYAGAENLNVNAELRLSCAANAALTLRPDVSFEANRMVFKVSGTIGARFHSVSVSYDVVELELFRVGNLVVDGDGLHFDLFEWAPDVRQAIQAVMDMVHFDESMYRNHLAADTDYRSAQTALDGDLNDAIIHEQAGRDRDNYESTRPPGWVVEARRIHDHLVHGHVSEVVGILLEAERAGGQMGLSDEEKALARETVSTLERLLDSRATTMDFAPIREAALRLDELCYFRESLQFGTESDRFVRARNVLRYLSQGRAQSAADELGFRSQPAPVHAFF